MNETGTETAVRAAQGVEPRGQLPGVEVPAAELVKLLERHRKEQNAERTRAAQLWHEGGWLFATRTGYPLNPNTDYHEWKQLLKDAGLRDGRLHDARHTAATVLLHPEDRGTGRHGHHGLVECVYGKRYQHITDPILKT